MKLAVFGANGPTIAGMHAAGIKRLVCVSSSAVAPHPEPLGGFIFEKIMQPYVVNKLGKTLYDDMRRETIAVATPSAKPSMLKLIWQEGIRKKA